MPTITLPDGSQRSFPSPVDGGTIARSIGSRLERDAVAVRIDGALKDLTLPIEHDARIEIVTRTSADGLELLRHDAAHVMAEAVKELYPETQVTIGPAIENGFYYDFARSTPFTPEDLERIEKRMHEIVARDEKIVREVWDRDAAVEFFLKQGEVYKAEIIRSIPAGEPITLYRQGDFIDLCRGPHLPSTGRLGAGFKLMKLAGAYWRGNSDNEMLQRIYGTAWADAKELKAYLDRLEEAERRDHRKLGRQMDLFHFQDEAVGAVFWHTKGWQLFRTLVDFMRAEARRRGLSRGQHARAHVALAVGGVGPLAHLRREHVHEHDGRRADVRRQADELPRPRAGLQERPAQLPRSALSPGGVRQGAPLRTFGRAARTHACEGVHARRRARVLHRGADHRGSGQDLPAAARHLSRLRLRRT